MVTKVASSSLIFKDILREFPRNMKFCFAYGSAVFKQNNNKVTTNMLDLIFVVDDPDKWHAENMLRNSHHYAQPLRLLGSNFVSKVQDNFGAKIYYNTLIQSNNGRLIKYGVVTEKYLIQDLLDWNMLYLAGRLHKPTQVLIKPNDNSQLPKALVQNLKSAVHSALLLLPENFTDIDLYKTITNLSYNGDFRMTFGEDKSKIDNIVTPQLDDFRELYKPILKTLENFIELPKTQSNIPVNCRQDDSPAAKIHHLNQLPRNPQVKLVKKWNESLQSKDIEDCLRLIAHDSDCSNLLNKVLRDIVWMSSVTQSLKGILTAGLVKSIKYSYSKIIKMIKSSNKHNDNIKSN